MECTSTHEPDASSGGGIAVVLVPRVFASGQFLADAGLAAKRTDAIWDDSVSSAASVRAAESARIDSCTATATEWSFTSAAASASGTNRSEFRHSASDTAIVPQLGAAAADDEGSVDHERHSARECLQPQALRSVGRHARRAGSCHARRFVNAAQSRRLAAAEFLRPKITRCAAHRAIRAVNPPAESRHTPVHRVSADPSLLSAARHRRTPR
jgi:hypothetical protein